LGRGLKGVGREKFMKWGEERFAMGGEGVGGVRGKTLNESQELRARVFHQGGRELGKCKKRERRKGGERGKMLKSRW